MSSRSELIEDISSHLASKSLQPTPAWIETFVSSSRPNTPLHALRQTALFRVLASDFRDTLVRTPGTTFPAGLTDASVKERRLAGPIPVQVLEVDDIGKSRWSQVEEIEAAERGETTKGREIIRVIPNEDGSTTQDEHRESLGPHKLLLQDAQGAVLYGIELINVNGIDLSMKIGTKLVLRNVTIARGVTLLSPDCVEVLGGKIESLHELWKDNRKEALKSLATATQQSG